MVHLKELALFAGAGGGILGGKLLGWRTVCAVEIEPYCREVLMRRQDEGHLEPFPIWDDVRTFDGTEWRGKVDVVSGGFPCQDISVAGKGDGLDGERSGLWREMARIIGEVRPRFAFVENSPALVRRGLDAVLGDLAAMGYDCRWGVVSAADVGAPHQRERIWVLAVHTDQQVFGGCRPATDTSGIREAVANAAGDGRQSRGPGDTTQSQERGQPDRGSVGSEVPDTVQAGLQGQRAVAVGVGTEQHDPGNDSWWAIEPDVGRVANGVANRVDRLSAIGNGQVPAVAAAAWRILGGP